MSTEETLAWIAGEYGSEAAFSLGFGREGMIIVDMIFTQQLPIRVFTLDTGRLFQETHELFHRTVAKYKRNIEVYFPDNKDIENLVSKKGPVSFYDSVENRKECCYLRKLKPLKRALQGTKIWITGLRSGQSGYRSQFGKFYWDEQHQLIKYSPLFDWQVEDVDAYIKKHKVPYNTLHDKGFASIGCAPCTRAILPEEDERAGRWWWEDSHKECGMHAAVKSSELNPTYSLTLSAKQNVTKTKI